jgi:hypothetical protein
LEESSKAFGRLQSFVAGPPKNGVQFMVKNLKKYTSTGGWGFAQFNDGKPADEAVHNTCFSCHEAVKARDFVFARYARMARLDHRTDEDHRSADQSHGAWRQRIRCVPSGDSVNAGLRILRQTDRPRVGCTPHRACLDRADEAPRVHEIRGARRLISLITTRAATS